MAVGLTDAPNKLLQQTAKSLVGFNALRAGRATSCVSPLLSWSVRRVATDASLSVDMSADWSSLMAQRPRVTKLISRFKIEKGAPGQVQAPFVQNNGATFTFSTGTEGIVFSLSDSDLLDLIRHKKNWRVVLADDA
jgi:hypothetical protein